MLFLVALLYLFSFASAGCEVDHLSACINLALTHMGNYTVCDCWSEFEFEVKDCDESQKTVLSTLISSIKLACPNAPIEITPDDCESSGGAYQWCIVLSSTPNSKSACDCYNDYKTHSEQYCTSGEDKLYTYPVCREAKTKCDTITCQVDCSLFEGEFALKVETESDDCYKNSTTEIEHCDCYTSSHDLIGSFTSVCQDAAKVSLSSCVKAQLGCSSLLTSETCVSTEAELKIEDISKLFDDDVNKEKFISNWNTKFSQDGKSITVSTCDKTTNGNDEIVFTVTVTYDDTKQTLQQVIDDLKKVFSITIGLPESKLRGSGHSDKNKRSVLATATVTMTGGGNAGGGVSALSFVILPALFIVGAFHYFF